MVEECKGCAFGKEELCGKCDLMMRDPRVHVLAVSVRKWPGAKPCCDCVQPCERALKIIKKESNA